MSRETPRFILFYLFFFFCFTVFISEYFPISPFVNIQQDYYFPIYLIDPLESNRAAPAFDINSNPLRHEALVKAASTSLPVTTENIVLVSETGTQVLFSSANTD